jgi:hypothetical protein
MRRRLNLNGDGTVDATDILLILSDWGIYDADDLLLVISNWGSDC